MNTIKSTRLFYKDGNSDKEYNASINEVDGKYTVTFAYGRRGNALTAGTKTNAPVDLLTAQKVYDKLVGEKTAKGYTASGDGVAFALTENADRVSGLSPQLLNIITEEEALALLKDSAWGMQEKHDGRRIMVKIVDGKVEGSNRKGLIVALPQELVDAFKGIKNCELDGELVGNTFKMFDLLSTSHPFRAFQDLREWSYGTRYLNLYHMKPDFTSPLLQVSELYENYFDKHKMYQEFKDNRKEGVVFKNLSAPYVAGRPQKGGNQLKFKFYDTCTCNVLEVNNQRSVKLSMVCGTFVGNVTIPANHNIPSKGDLVEVRYLYYYKNGSLYQPVYLGKRDDIDTADTVASLKLKASDSDDE